MKIIPDSIRAHLPILTSRGGHTRVVRDWFMLLIISIFIIVIEIMWSISFFRDNIIIRAPVQATVVSTATINTKSVQHVQAIFSKRASMQSAYESNAVLLADPAK